MYEVVQHCTIQIYIFAVSTVRKKLLFFTPMVSESAPNSSQKIDPQSNALTDIVKAQMASKRVIETELESIVDALNSEALAHIGLRKHLVDESGFPIAGIDLLQVRTYRNRFAVLQTDLKEIDKTIEESLHRIHEHARATGSVSRGDERQLAPFGRVDSVAPDSAAEFGGLVVGDKIVRFGRLSCFSAEGVKDCYDAIPTILRDLEPGQSFEVKVIRLGRESEDITLSISPIGGRLGCLIRPI